MRVPPERARVARDEVVNEDRGRQRRQQRRVFGTGSLALPAGSHGPLRHPCGPVLVSPIQPPYTVEVEARGLVEGVDELDDDAVPGGSGEGERGMRGASAAD